MSFSDRLSIVVFLAVCFLCTLSQAENQAAAQADEASLIGFPSSDILLAEDDSSDQDDAIEEDKRGMPGVMRFGKRGDMPGVLRFGKRGMPGVMRFGKKAMPGVMRFGKKSMPGVMRFGKRMIDDDEDMEKRKAGPAPIRFG